jgi:hypothetical protein
MPEIREDQSVAAQSKIALTLAQALGLLTFRKPVEVRAEEAMKHLRAELGHQATLINDDGQYYWAYVTSDDGKQYPTCIPEGEVVATCRILALKKYGPEVARRFEYRQGVIPG